MRKELNVFIVDDDPICREMFRKYMSNMNFERISLFENGPDCLDALPAKPDIILLDYHMVPMDGLELLHKIKRHNPHIYLVFVSGQEAAPVAAEAIRSGAFDYVTKGTREEQQLRDVISKILNVMQKLGPRPSGWSRFFSAFSTC